MSNLLPDFDGLIFHLAYYLGLVGLSCAVIGLHTFTPTQMGFFHADLIEYCNGVSTQNLLGIGASNKRSAFAMLLPRHFAKTQGVFDGLALGAVWGQVGIGALLYWWGTLIDGRRMGISVLLLACVAAPLTFISRVLSSYPAMSLCFVAGATATMWGIKSHRTLPHVHRGHRCQHDITGRHSRNRLGAVALRATVCHFVSRSPPE